MEDSKEELLRLQYEEELEEQRLKERDRFVNTSSGFIVTANYHALDYINNEGSKLGKEDLISKVRDIINIYIDKFDELLIQIVVSTPSLRDMIIPDIQRLRTNMQYVKSQCIAVAMMRSS